MELKVRALDGIEEKSVQEIENELLKKHEEQFEENETTDSAAAIDVDSAEDVVVEEKVDRPTIQDEDVLSYIKERYDKDIDSVEQLFDKVDSNDSLPEDVLKYFKYKKETGRGIEDFYKLQKDYDTMDEDSVLADYLAATEEGLDAIDIQDIMEDKFGFDEDLDEPRDVKKVKLAKKRELAKAKKFFNDQKDKYKVPLESSGGRLSQDQEKQLSDYKSYLDKSDNVADENKRKYEYFMNRSKEVFSSEFKGFDFSIGDSQISYKPGTSEELLNKQSDVNNFISKFLDDKGLITDAKGYHRALSVAMNPEKFAQFFYEQGVSSAVDNVTKKSKNINMDVRTSPQSVSKDGLKIRAVGESSSGRGLKIRSRK